MAKTVPAISKTGIITRKIAKNMYAMVTSKNCVGGFPLRPFIMAKILHRYIKITSGVMTPMKAQTKYLSRESSASIFFLKPL